MDIHYFRATPIPFSNRVLIYDAWRYALYWNFLVVSRFCHGQNILDSWCHCFRWRIFYSFRASSGTGDIISLMAVALLMRYFDRWRRYHWDIHRRWSRHGHSFRYLDHRNRLGVMLLPSAIIISRSPHRFIVKYILRLHDIAIDSGYWCRWGRMFASLPHFCLFIMPPFSLPQNCILLMTYSVNTQQ